MRIGIFDTGHGGVLVAERLRKALPKHDYLVVDDQQFLPYGNRSQTAIAHLTDRAIQSLLANSCDVIVIACGAATAAALDYLRGRYPAQTFIGFEPMLQPALELSHAKRVSVLASPSTLKSDLYRSQLKKFAGSASVHHPDCSGWAAAIEQGLTPENFDDVIDDIVVHGSDVVVLVCTHTFALQDDIAARTGTRVLDPSGLVARRISDINAKKAGSRVTAIKKPLRTVPRRSSRVS